MGDEREGRKGVSEGEGRGKGKERMRETCTGNYVIVNKTTGMESWPTYG
jgi:hypothetical protein